MSYSTTEIQTIRQNAKQQKLEAPQEFWSCSEIELQEILNGYGPDGWSDSAREVLTWIYRYYQESAGIHDVRYDNSTGQEVDRKVADNEFLTNLKKQWKYKYGWSRWINPVAIWAYTKINLAYIAVELWGNESYVAAYNNNQQERANSDEKSSKSSRNHNCSSYLHIFSRMWP